MPWFPLSRRVLPMGFYNFTGSNLANFAEALAGAGNVKIACVGDSTTAGYGATGNGGFDNAKSLSWPTQLAGLLTGASWSSFFCDNNETTGGGSTLPAFDTRIAMTGWAMGTDIGVAGPLIQSDSPATGALAFTPANSIDTIEVYYARKTASGVFTVDVGGSVLATVDTHGTASVQKATVNCTLGTHTINIKRTTANTNSVFIMGVVAYNSASREQSVYNLGGDSWDSNNFNVTTNPWSPLSALVTIAPHLVLLEAGIINDGFFGVDTTTATANRLAIINALKAINCDVILVSNAPANPNDAGPYGHAVDAATQVANVAAMKAQAYSESVPFINIHELFGGQFNAARMWDTLHPSSVGYAAIAGYVKQSIAAPLLPSGV